MTKAALTIVIVFLMQTAAPPAIATIEGVVRNASNGAPLPGVQVTAIRVANSGTGRSQGSKAMLDVLTDASGRFAITDLSAATYRVYAVRAGFGAMEYNQHPLSRMGEPIELGSGQTITNIDFSLPVAGVVTGHVTDVSGAPSCTNRGRPIGAHL